MGAQWVHGEKNNVVYEMAKHKIAVDESMSNYASAEAFLETGEQFDMELVFLIYSWIGEIEAMMPIKLKDFPGSLGDYYNQELAKPLCLKPKGFNNFHFSLFLKNRGEDKGSPRSH
jgi:hypothetical protein